MRHIKIVDGAFRGRTRAEVLHHRAVEEVRYGGARLGRTAGGAEGRGARTNGGEMVGLE